MKAIKTILISALAALSLIGLDLYVLRAAEGNKVPDDIALRIRTVQYDQAQKQNEATQMYIAWLTSPQGKTYDADQQTIQHDQQELDSLKKEALTTAKLDAATNDVDMQKLEFITKPKPPEAKK
jgi:hypothetical protein